MFCICSRGAGGRVRLAADRPSPEGPAALQARGPGQQGAAIENCAETAPRGRKLAPAILERSWEISMDEFVFGGGLETVTHCTAQRRVFRPAMRH